jgi:hypothetical protein
MCCAKRVIGVLHKLGRPCARYAGRNNHRGSASSNWSAIPEVALLWLWAEECKIATSQSHAYNHGLVLTVRMLF